MPRSVRAAASFFFYAALFGAVTLPCRAQALPQAGVGDVTYYAQHIEHHAVILADGFKAPGGHAYNRSIAAEIDYNLTSRLSLTAGLPLVFGKYLDPVPPPPPVNDYDSCRCLQANVQDFTVAARYVAYTSRRMSLTPSVSTVIPSHPYAFQGESVAGRRLRELTVALNASRRLDFLSRNAYFSARYAYSFVQKTLDVPLNRSNLTLEGGYRLRRNLGLRGVGDYLVRRDLNLHGIMLLQRTHGGLHAYSKDNPTAPPSEFTTQELRLQRDRLFRDNHIRLGAGASFSLGNTQILGNVIFHVTGTMTHAQTLVTIGVRRPFSWRARD